MMSGPRLVTLAVMGGLVVASCSSASNGGGSASSAVSESVEAPADSVVVQGEASGDDGAAGVAGEVGSFDVLPVREGPRRETTGSVPHQQIGAPRLPDVDQELRRRAFSLPGVGEAPSGVSLPGATALWLSDDVVIARPNAANDREFAHIHPDGSLHVWLPVERAVEVDAAKWGELHPWVERDGFWEGVVMVYTPESLDEVDVAMRLLVDSYNFVTGSDVDPTDF